MGRFLHPMCRLVFQFSFLALLTFTSSQNSCWSCVIFGAGLPRNTILLLVNAMQYSSGVSIAPKDAAVLLPIPTCITNMEWRQPTQHVQATERYTLRSSFIVTT